MNQLIESLLDYSKIDGAERGAGPADCRDALARALSNLRAAVDECGALVNYTALPVVALPPLELERLFQNLIGNATKFRGAKTPRIRVSARRRGKDWVISVQDNGIGIGAGPRRHPRLFHVFQRLHARGKYPGTGIGLAICKKIVEGYGGRIWAESAAGRGSTFRFTAAASA